MRVLYAATEVAGFAKTGGLADVAASLPAALVEQGVDCAVVLPLYNSARHGPFPIEPTGVKLTIPIGYRQIEGSVCRSHLPEENVPVYLIEQPDFFERDDHDAGRGFYQYTEVDGSKRDYPDNCARFVFFCRAILEAMRAMDFWPEVLHCNDWQTALLPVYLRELYATTRGESAARLRDRYKRVRSLLTIHNQAYQGLFWHLDMPLTGLPWTLFHYEKLEFHGHINFLKGGIVYADAISTVSPMYAREIQTPYYGSGLHGALAQRHRSIYGIVNGVDYHVWNPATDPYLAARYDTSSVQQGKAACKRALQRHYNVAEKPRTPLLGMVSRLADQKGLDLVAGAAERLLQHDLQLVVLGEGDAAYQAMLLNLRGRHPDRVGVTLAQDEKLAHEIEAGADIFLMPSQYEPCGLNQLYSLKYGTVPLVRATGGLADTVVDASEDNLAAGKATGFTFLPYTANALLETVQRALRLYAHQPDRWLALQRTGMAQDWSWARSAAEYVALYRSLVSGID